MATTLQSVYDQVRFICGNLPNVSTGPLSDASLLRLANIAQKSFWEEIVDIREDYFEEQSTTTLINNQDEYPLPTDFYKLQRVEVNYVDSTDNTWVTATEVDETPVSNIEWEWMRLNKSTSEPVFRLFDQSIFLAPTYSLTAAQIITNGFKIYYTKRPTDFVASTDVLSFPYDVFYKVLAKRIAIDVYASLGQFDKKQLQEADFAREIQKVKTHLSQTDESPVITQLPNDSGSNY